MKRARLLTDEGWRGYGVTFSRTDPGDLRTDMEPHRNEDTGLIGWRAICWRGTDRSDVVFIVDGRSCWDTADLHAEALKGVRS